MVLTLSWVIHLETDTDIRHNAPHLWCGAVKGQVMITEYVSEIESQILCNLMF